MPQAPLRLVKYCVEFKQQSDISKLPLGLRGIYVLYKRRRRKGGRDAYDVVYVGMSKAGRQGHVRFRLDNHRRSKGQLWTHFSVFEVWDNVFDDEVSEFEGILRHIYRRDSGANKLNIRRGFKKLDRIRRPDFSPVVERYHR